MQAFNFDKKGFQSYLEAIAKQYIKNKPTNEELKTAFAEVLVLTHSIGTAATACNWQGEPPTPAKLIALYLVGFLKGLECAQSEAHLLDGLKVHVNSSDFPATWLLLEQLNEIISISL